MPAAGVGGAGEEVLGDRELLPVVRVVFVFVRFPFIMPSSPLLLFG